MKELWPGWETVEAIGSGGFSKVYKIRKRETGDERDYYSALKIISIPQSSDEYDAYLGEGYDDDTITGIFTSQVKRIVEEFHMMSRFRGNSNIVSYEDHMIVPHEDGKGWEILIRMELLTSLTKHCTKSTMSEEETVKLGIGICRALELCQKMNIIHRDIKPQNIFVNEFGDYKLGDFGIAKSMDHTTHATKTGTYSYMAPEVYRGEAYGSTIDLYSLGLVLYWLLNERRLPFLPLPPEAPTAAQINESQVRRLSGEALPAPKNGSDDLKRIVLKACAHNAADRYATAAAMRRDMEKALFVLEATAEEAVVAVPVAAVAVSEPAGVANDADDGNEKTEGLFSYHAPVVSVVAEKAAEESAEEADEAQETAGSFSQAAPVAVETEAEEAVDKSDATVGLFGGHTVKASAEPAENTAEEESNPIPEPVSTLAPAPAPAPAPTPVPAPAPKKSGKGKWFAIISGVLLVVVVVVLLLLRGCEDGEGTGTETTTNGIDGIVDPGATTTKNQSATDELITLPHDHITVADEWDSDDESHWYNCSCGEKVEKANHAFGEWTVIRPATETESGEKERSCSECGYKQTEAIPALAHTHSYASTWSTDSSSHWRECNCGNKSSVASHTYGNWITTKAATESSSGSRERSCTVCGYKQTETIPALAHTHSYSSTWTKNSSYHWHECDCGDKSNLTAHTYGSWTTTKAATCTTSGTQKNTCTTCGYTQTQLIAAIGHSWVDATYDKPKTCVICQMTSGSPRNFFENLSGNGSAGYMGAHAVDVHYYDGMYYYVVDDVIKRSVYLGGADTDIWSMPDADINSLCIIDGYIFFSHQDETGEYVIGAIDIDGTYYLEVLDSGSGCYYHDGWIYTNRSGSVVRIKPGDPDSYDLVGTGRIVALDTNNDYIYIETNGYGLVRRNTDIDMGILVIGDFLSVNQAYVYEGILYFEAYTKQNGWKMYTFSNEQVSVFRDSVDSFTVCNEAVIFSSDGLLFAANMDGSYSFQIHLLTIDWLSLASNNYSRIVAVNDSCIAFLTESNSIYVLNLNTSSLYKLS